MRGFLLVRSFNPAISDLMSKGIIKISTLKFEAGNFIEFAYETENKGVSFRI